MRGITSLACVLHAIVISAAAHAGAPSREVLRLPLTIERNNPVTTIGIAGRDIPIIVDTGGGVLALTRETLERGRAVSLDEDPLEWTDTHGRAHRARRNRVPRASIGGREFTDLPAIEAVEARDGPTVPNILGRDFLRRFIVVIDYPAGMMTLLSPRISHIDAERSGCRGSRLPLESVAEAGLVVTRATLDQGTLRLLWDTGATYSALPAAWAQARRLPLTPAEGERPPFFRANRLVLGSIDQGPFEFAVP